MSDKKTSIRSSAWAVYCAGIDSPICISPNRRDCQLFLASIPSDSPVKRRLSLKRVDVSFSR